MTLITVTTSTYSLLMLNHLVVEIPKILTMFELRVPVMEEAGVKAHQVPFTPICSEVFVYVVDTEGEDYVVVISPYDDLFFCV